MAAYMPTKAAIEDWTTAEEELELVRAIFGGGIDFDPCGNPNSIVGAERQIWLPKWTPRAPCPVHGEPVYRAGCSGCARSFGEVLPGSEDVPRVPFPDAPPLPSTVILGDGLEVAWRGTTFVNPPFNAKTLGRFLEKAAREMRRGVPSILLTKVKTGIQDWRPNAGQAAAIAFADHRLTFGGGGGDTAPFDSCMVLFTESRTLINRFASVLEDWGDVMFHR